MFTLHTSASVPQPSVMQRAVDVLSSGGVVAYPTDTLYGLAVDPRRDDAVARLFALKGRSVRSAIPLIGASTAQVELLAELGVGERMLARTFWPGPLTLVLKARPGLAPTLLADGDTVAIRVPAHAVARQLADTFGFGITATSANPSGRTAPASAADIDADLHHGIDLLLDAGLCAGGPPSTIVELTGEGPRLIRAGPIAWDRVLESLQ